jgi:aerobic carbon-monoxide dehydrogenase medium subunit
MIPTAFDYVAPASLDEVVEVLAEHGDDAKILAGGHSLLPLMKLRLAVPAILVDLGRVPDLRFIREFDGSVAIGAMTTYADLEESDLIRTRLPLLAQATAEVGDVQVRNRGTLGGALAHADPAGDMPTVVSALGGSVVVRGPNGEREVSIDDFFVDLFTSALEPDEVLTEIRLRSQAGAAGRYEKFRRRQIDWAIVGAAVNVARDGDTIREARVALTNVGPRPIRATAVEDALRSAGVDASTIDAAAERASEGLNPSSELAGSAEYKKHLARVLTRRALAAALQVG